MGNVADVREGAVRREAPARSGGFLNQAFGSKKLALVAASCVLISAGSSAAQTPFTQPQIDAMRADQACFVRQPDLTDYAAIDQNCAEDEATLLRAFHGDEQKTFFFSALIVITSDHGQKFVDALFNAIPTTYGDDPDFRQTYTLGPPPRN
jgi:hypothetical protein